jgi:hypothetical protein
MQKVLVTCPTHRGISHNITKESIRQLCVQGAELLIASSISDIAGGRSWLLSTALRKAEADGRDVIMLVDDDMSFTREQAEQLVTQARERVEPCSGVYPTAEGDLTAMRWRPFKFLCGLGFAAIPTTALRHLADNLRPVMYGDKDELIWPFCESRAHYSLGRWLAEDYDLSAKLGGFRLLPIAVGHIKPVPLVAVQEDVDRICDWAQQVDPDGGYLGWQYREPQLTTETDNGL